MTWSSLAPMSQVEYPTAQKNTKPPWTETEPALYISRLSTSRDFKPSNSFMTTDVLHIEYIQLPRPSVDSGLDT
jgi:hypothetical protein